MENMQIIAILMGTTTSFWHLMLMILTTIMTHRPGVIQSVISQPSSRQVLYVH